jgi:catechol 2,3-dioxygenase-like lactoylglutathione lyase family enzyme
MVKATGVHHLAISSGIMREQIEFFSDVLGMELVALYKLHGAPPGNYHAFLKLNDKSYIGFTSKPGTEDMVPEFDKTHPGVKGLTVPGTMGHVALKVDTEAELLAMRDRIRSRGINAVGPWNHGFCKSIYFSGLENLSLEIAWSPEPIDKRAWIDPEVAETFGISAEQLSRLTNPDPADKLKSPVPQPPIESASCPRPPHLRQEVLELSDEEFVSRFNHPDPPVVTARE